MTQRPYILVVDDQPINVKLLQRKLEREDMEIGTAFDGRQCLQSVAERHPDLILLDVMMPEMDGLEVCRQLKENEQTQSIPIIFITAKSSKEGKLEGLGLGAADYITKPIDLEETLARVHTQLRIQDIHRLNLDLQRRLADARQSAAVGAITQGIAHNLNNLLGVVVGYLDLIRNGIDSPEMVRRSTSLMDQAIHRMVTIVRQLSMMATTEKYYVSPTPLDAALTATVERFHAEHRVPGEVQIENPLGHAARPLNAEMFEAMLGRLLINAFESYSPDHTGPREILLAAEDLERGGKKWLAVRVHDRGAGIDGEVAEHLFEPFITSKTSVGRGLGLTIARHCARNLGGDLVLSPREGGGTTAELTLPA